MSLNRKLISALVPLSLLALGACATPFRADVSRFQQLPQPAGQTFYIQPGDREMAGGLEFQTYAAQVSQRLSQQGYRPAASRADAELIVGIDYGVDNGREKIVSRPGFGGWGGGWGGWGGGWGGYGGFGYGRFGYGGFGYRPWAFGWNDPFWGPGFGGWGGGTQIDSYTYYTSFLDMRISRRSDGQRLFEGHAKARSMNDRLTEIVPNLVDAMFTEFPGRSGEEIRITITPPGRDGNAPPPKVSTPPRGRN